MSVVVVGLNHKTSPISLLERLAVAEEELPKALHQLMNYEHVVEAAVLSTCNRIEVYAVPTRFHGGVQDLRNFLAEFRHVAPEDFTDRLYTYHEDAAIRHLFRVAAGVDSLVVGESEILGQVRRAYHHALQEGTLRKRLGRAFRQAIRVGRRARTETAIGRNPVSVSSAAVELARRAFDDRSLDGRRVLLVGAGKMGKLAARALHGAGARDVTVVNRTPERARDLAELFGGVPRPIEELAECLVGADIVITSTTAPQAVLERDLVAAAIARRDASSALFIVDIAVPRDVDPAVGELPGVVLRGIDDLRGVVESSVGSRLGELGKVEEIVDAEVTRFAAWDRASEMAPAISTLVARAEAVRTQELDAVRSRLKDLAPEQRAAVEHATKRIISKLLHDPLNNARELASSKQSHIYLDALRELFELDDDPEQ